jgi:hypothetical protein
MLLGGAASQVAEKLAWRRDSRQGTTLEAAEKVGFRLVLAVRPAFKWLKIRLGFSPLTYLELTFSAV